MKTKILGYDEDGFPVYALTRKQAIAAYALMALGLIVLSAVVVLIVGG